MVYVIECIIYASILTCDILLYLFIPNNIMDLNYYEVKNKNNDINPLSLILVSLCGSTNDLLYISNLLQKLPHMK